jgi:stage II sporulation protein D
MKIIKTTLIFSISIFLLNIIFTVPAMADGELPAQPWIRVALATGQSTLAISANGASHLSRAESTDPISSFDLSHTYTFDTHEGKVRLTSTGGEAFDGFAVVTESDNSRIQYCGRSYRGFMRVVIWDGALCLINVAPIEQYLWGVVPCEMPDEWSYEAIRAQAVAARTYSMRALEQYPERPFDVYASVVDQVYHGASGEASATTQACIDTVGLVCTFNGAPIVAYYHAASGGWTASGGEMFGADRDYPYLCPVPSRDSTVYRWNYSISSSNLANALRNNGYSIGTIQRVWVHRFSPEGRVEEIKVVHTSGVDLVSGPDLRHILGPANLQSTYFTVEGQDAPAIPESLPDTQLSNAPVSIFDLSSPYSSTNPSIYIPVPVESMLYQCRIQSSEGDFDVDRFVVLGANGTSELSDGHVYIAKLVHAGELDGTSFTGTSDLPSQVSGNLIEDPGQGIGTPQNGMLIFVGHGCGHGVGMSQHGARILAESGWTYDSILRYFYTGIEIERYW